MDYFETSAKDNINITEVMNHIMEKVYDNLYKNSNDNEIEDGKTSIVLGARGHNNNQKKEIGKTGCCSQF